MHVQINAAKADQENQAGPDQQGQNGRGRLLTRRQIGQKAKKCNACRSVTAGKGVAVFNIYGHLRAWPCKQKFEDRDSKLIARDDQPQDRNDIKPPHQHQKAGQANQQNGNRLPNAKRSDGGKKGDQPRIPKGENKVGDAYVGLGDTGVQHKSQGRACEHDEKVDENQQKKGAWQAAEPRQ